MSIAWLPWAHINRQWGLPLCVWLTAQFNGIICLSSWFIGMVCPRKQRWVFLCLPCLQQTQSLCFLYWIWGKNGTEREKFSCTAVWDLDQNLPHWRCKTVGMRADLDTRLLGFKPLLHLWQVEWLWVTYLTSFETLFSSVKWRCNRTYFTSLLQRVNEGTIHVKTLGHRWLTVRTQ